MKRVMTINMAKLQKYLENGNILEFENDVKFAHWFREEVFCLGFTIEEMKKYQGEYGFSLPDGKRYHILLDDALDVYEYAYTFEPEETKLIHTALMGYGNKLDNLNKELTEENEIICSLINKAKEVHKLAKKFTY